MSHMTSIDYRLFVTILLERLKVVKDKHVSVFLWHKKRATYRRWVLPNTLYSEKPQPDRVMYNTKQLTRMLRFKYSLLLRRVNW